MSGRRKKVITSSEEESEAGEDPTPRRSTRTKKKDNDADTMIDVTSVDKDSEEDEVSEGSPVPRKRSTRNKRMYSYEEIDDSFDSDFENVKPKRANKSNKNKDEKNSSKKPKQKDFLLDSEENSEDDSASLSGSSPDVFKLSKYKYKKRKRDVESDDGSSKVSSVKSSRSASVSRKKSKKSQKNAKGKRNPSQKEGVRKSSRSKKADVNYKNEGSEGTYSFEEEESSNSDKESTSTFQSTDIFPDPEFEELVPDKLLLWRENVEDGKRSIEILVTYKDMSYRKAAWVSKESLSDGLLPTRVQRLLMKDPEQLMYSDEEPFNSNYLDVERVIDSTEIYRGDERVTKYLVKWRSLSYDYCTWETESEINDHVKIERFLKTSVVPTKNDTVYTRPALQDWVNLKTSPEYNDGRALRDYQLEGLNWIMFTYLNKRNCILADEMGLGKTMQTVSFIHQLTDVHGLRSPHIIIAPLSTIPHWQREFESLTDINVVVYHGSKKARSIIESTELFFFNERGTAIPHKYKFDVVITTFEMVSMNSNLFSKIPWKSMIVDEAHRLKNSSGKLSQQLSEYKVDCILLLTGTPLQNNIEELWSLLNFLGVPDAEDYDEFMDRYGDIKTESRVTELQKILKPVLLRRLKEDVEKSIAPKEETIVEVELTPTQKQYYKAILEKNFKFLAQGTTSKNLPNLMNAMMDLRKCCNHPFLFEGAEETIKRQLPSSTTESERLVASCGKVVLLDKLLPKLKENGHRVLIFSQMTRVLDILEDYIRLSNYSYERLDGGIRGDLRQAAIDRFSREGSDTFIFLLSTKAGGVGINLTAADTVIIYDSDWNPQNDMQAQARCHRIGQKKSVKVYRLITSNSYEKEMFEKANLKMGLEKAVLQKISGRNTDKENVKNLLSKDEIEELLKKGAYGALLDDDTAGQSFCDENIDDILSRRTRTINMERPEEVAGSTFSKANFVVNTNSQDNIDMNDPEFWKKWADKADIDYEKITKEDTLIIEGPRRTRNKKSHFSKKDEYEAGSDEEYVAEDEFRPDERRAYKGKNPLPKSKAIYKQEKLNFLKLFKSYGLCRWKKYTDLFRHFELTESGFHAIGVKILQMINWDGDGKVWATVDKYIPISVESDKPSNVEDGEPGENRKEKVDDAKMCELFFDKTVLNALSNSKHMNSKLKTLSHLYRILRPFIRDIEAGKQVSDIGIKIPLFVETPSELAWWTGDCDVSLLCGAYKYGVHNGLSIDSAIEDEQLSLRKHKLLSDSDETYKFPDQKFLNERLKRLLKITVDNYRQASLPKHTEPWIQNNDLFSSKMKKNVISTLQSFGFPEMEEKWNYNIVLNCARIDNQIHIPLVRTIALEYFGICFCTLFKMEIPMPAELPVFSEIVSIYGPEFYKNSAVFQNVPLEIPLRVADDALSGCMELVAIRKAVRLMGVHEIKNIIREESDIMDISCMSDWWIPIEHDCSYLFCLAYYGLRASRFICKNPDHIYLQKLPTSFGVLDDAKLEWFDRVGWKSLYSRLEPTISQLLKVPFQSTNVHASNSFLTSSSGVGNSGHSSYFNPTASSNPNLVYSSMGLNAEATSKGLASKMDTNRNLGGTTMSGKPITPLGDMKQGHGDSLRTDRQHNNLSNSTLGTPKPAMNKVTDTQVPKIAGTCEEGKEKMNSGLQSKVSDAKENKENMRVSSDNDATKGPESRETLKKRPSKTSSKNSQGKITSFFKRTPSKHWDTAH
eukprot:Nk52_evm13s352 gene=Nk52_evmTU13s352